MRILSAACVKVVLFMSVMGDLLRFCQARWGLSATKLQRKNERCKYNNKISREKDWGRTDGAELQLRRLNKKHLSPAKQATHRGPNRAIRLNPD